MKSSTAGIDSTRLWRILAASALSLTVSWTLIAPAAPSSADPAQPQPGPGAAQAPESVGSWQVRRVAAGTYQVSWTSPSRLPVGAARPELIGLGGQRVGPTALAADGRTVSAQVLADQGPGPADFDVVLSGDRIDVAGDDRVVDQSGSSGSPWTQPQRRSKDPTSLAVDPGRRGRFTTVSSDYRLPPVKLPGMKKPIEMIGHVVEPASGSLASPAPLVLFQHGRHESCYNPSGEAGGDATRWPCRAPFREIPSQLGYDYVQQLLASQGFVTVSIRVNGINAQDYRLLDGGADARAAIIERHLDHWVDLAADHQVDLDRVVLVGHSRGGEGVDRASLQIPTSAPYRIAGQVLIAPTNFGTQTAPFVPTVTLLPSCDGDVSDLQGQQYTDVARDLAAGDTSLKSSVMVLGANHNFFNTEWTPSKSQAPSSDDWYGPAQPTCGKDNPGRLSAGQQRRVAQTYIAGAVGTFAGVQDSVALFDGSPVQPASIGAARTLSHAIGGGRDTRAPGTDTSLSLADGARTSFCRGLRLGVPNAGLCGQRLGYVQLTPHWPNTFERKPSRQFFQMSWSAAGQRGGMSMATPLDLSTNRLELRTLVDARIGPVELDLRLTDADGASVQVRPRGPALLRPVQRGVNPITWAQTLMVDPGQLGGIDPSRVTTVELVSRNQRGRVWVADLSAAPAALAPVPRRRAATIDVDNVTVRTSDRTGTVQVPIRINGLTEPARVLVTTIGPSVRDRSQYVLYLAAGQTSASLPVAYKFGAAGIPRHITSVVLFALSGAMTDVYNAKVRIIDSAGDR